MFPQNPHSQIDTRIIDIQHYTVSEMDIIQRHKIRSINLQTYRLTVSHKCWYSDEIQQKSFKKNGGGASYHIRLLIISYKYYITYIL